MRGGAYFFAEVGPQAPATLATPTTGVLAVLAPCRWHAGAQESQPVAPPQLAAVGAGHALARLGDEYPASHVGAWGVSKVGQVSAWVQGAQGLARIAGQGHGAPPAPPPPPPPSGLDLLHYDFIREIGQGGFATVVLAEERGKPGKPVAIKLLPRGAHMHWATSAAKPYSCYVSREVLHHASLRHPFVVQVYEARAAARRRRCLCGAAAQS